MSKHIKGPWRVQFEQATHGKNRCVVAEDSFIVARIPFGEPCDEANAQLIAAAPKLLEALQATLETIKALTEEYDLIESYRLGEAAIAKAEGRASWKE